MPDGTQDIKPNHWLGLLNELSEASIECPASASEISRLTHTIARINQRLKNNKKMGPKIKELLQTYRESLRMCLEVWCLQSEQQIQAAAFMFDATHPMKPEDK